ITVQRNGQLQTMPWLMPAISQGNQAWRLVGLLFYLPFWLVGTAVLLLLRPRDQRWRLLAAFNYVTAFWLAVGMVSQSQVAASSLVLHAVSWLFVPIYLHLHLLVPTPLLRPRLRTYLLLLLYALAAVLAALELFQLLPSSVYTLGLLLAIPGSLGLLVWRLFDRSSPAARLAARVMLAGIGLALGPGIVLGLIPKLLNSAAPEAMAMSVAMVGIPLLPLAYAYALYKRTLGPLEFRANRLLSLYGFALLYLTAFAVVLVVGRSWSSSPDEFMAFILVVSTVLVIVAPASRARFQRLVDRLAYGIRYDPDEIFRACATRIPAALDRPVLVSLLADEIAPSLLIRESALVLLTNDETDLVYARGVNLAQIPETPQQIRGWLAEAGRYRPPLPEAAVTRTGASDQCNPDWVRLVIAIQTRGQMMGIWLFGRRDPDDYYPQPDIALLTALAAQVAVTVDNAQLCEDLQRQMDELRHAQDQLIQSAKMAAIGTLTAGVAHELSTPTTTVLGFAQWLLKHEDQAFDDSARKAVNHIISEARRACDIVRRMLDFSRQSEFNLEVGCVNQVVQDTVALLHQNLMDRNVTVEGHYAPDLPSVLLDVSRMKQVFLNLISNAGQAMPQGGILTVTSERVGDEVAVRIIDTGVGIPPEHLPRVFDPFFTTKPAGQGTGLGLSVSLGIVQDHGGRIEVESQVGKGSTLVVWLPIHGSLPDP
ncbi:MAG: hypothetical protein KKB13_30190, partial [Chloroflexi bacterium]|nr:hypothetical protein [Chloroflexota bacterium]